MRFYSDNTATIAPELLAAIGEANQGAAVAYGDDPWTGRLDGTFSELFAAPVRVFPVATGTAANSLILATLSPPYGAVFVHEEGHIAVDECGAPAFFTGGAQLTLLHGEHAKLSPATLAAALDAHPPSVHSVQPSVLSLTQATELGAVYTPEELAALCRLAHSRGLSVHLDGARFANAVAFLGCEPADLSWRAGVDALSFGATKNGALAAEAAVFFRAELVRDFELRRKRAGHLISKSRFFSAQLLAYVENGLWLRNARRANAMAQRIGAAAGHRLLHPVQSNEVFLQLGEDAKAALRERGFEFYDWGAGNSGQARFVAAWDQREADVAALCKALSATG